MSTINKLLVPTHSRDDQPAGPFHFLFQMSLKVPISFRCFDLGAKRGSRTGYWPQWSNPISPLFFFFPSCRNLWFSIPGSLFNVGRFRTSRFTVYISGFRKPWPVLLGAIFVIDERVSLPTKAPPKPAKVLCIYFYTITNAIQA